MTVRNPESWGAFFLFSFPTWKLSFRERINKPEHKVKTTVVRTSSWKQKDGHHEKKN